MRTADIPAARELSFAAFELVRGAIPGGGLGPAAGTSTSGATDPAGTDIARRNARWERRASFLLEHDPDGCWVADDGSGTVIGVTMSMVREKLWGLSALFVRPDQQNKGVGAALLDAALGYSQGCLRGVVISTEDPRAARRYRRAGFDLHPTMRIAGVVDRSAIPAVDTVRVGGTSDRDLCDSVDRRARGAAHGVDHEFLSREYTLLVTDQLTGSGYCYVDENGSPVLLGATTKRLAGQLLWAALDRSRPDVPVAINYLTSDQDWAVDVALAAGLSLRTEGYLCLRHMRPPAPYLPSGAFL